MSRTIKHKLTLAILLATVFLLHLKIDCLYSFRYSVRFAKTHRNLQTVREISKLNGIIKKIEYPNQYELPFLRGTPVDLSHKELLKNKNAPHIFVPLKYPDPWYDIKYPRMPYALFLKNWYVDPESGGAIFNGQQKLLLKFNKYDVYHNITNAPLKKPIITIDEGIHLLQKCADGYYHFLIELLPRLLLVMDIIRQNPSMKILINAPEKKFMCDFFELVQIDPSRIIFCNPKYLYHVKHLCYPKPPFMGYPSQQELFRTRKLLLQQLENTKPVTSNNADLMIVIKRREKKRRVTNIQKLVRELKNTFPSFANKVVVFDGSISVKEQIGLFRRARVIIGPHGAGFSNMLFSNPGTLNIEFIPENYFSILYWHVASALGLKHRHVVIPKKGNNDSFKCPIDKIIKILKRNLED